MNLMNTLTKDEALNALQKWILYRDNTERLEDQANEHDYYGVFG